MHKCISNRGLLFNFMGRTYPQISLFGLDRCFAQASTRKMCRKIMSNQSPLVAPILSENRENLIKGLGDKSQKVFFSFQALFLIIVQHVMSHHVVSMSPLVTDLHDRFSVIFTIQFSLRDIKFIRTEELLFVNVFDQFLFFMFKSK